MRVARSDETVAVDIARVPPRPFLGKPDWENGVISEPMNPSPSMSVGLTTSETIRPVTGKFRDAERADTVIDHLAIVQTRAERTRFFGLNSSMTRRHRRTRRVRNRRHRNRIQGGSIVILPRRSRRNGSRHVRLFGISLVITIWTVPTKWRELILTITTVTI